MKKLVRKITAVIVAAGLMLPTAADLSGINLGMTVVASAETVNSGTCGESLNWTLDENGTLTISGSGDMSDFSDSDVPWYLNREDIKSVVIETGVTSIGENAFYYCTNLENAAIPDTVISIGKSAFQCCSSLKSITIPDGVSVINGYAFQYCSSLQSINIPDNVTKIDGYAFTNCTSLSGITIPKKVTSIDSSAFIECSGLSSINVAEENTEYCSVDGVLFNKDKTTLMLYPAKKSGTSYTIPQGVNAIQNHAFSGCTNLIKVHIPKSVNSIGKFVFNGCTNLTEINVETGNTDYSSVDGVLYAMDDTRSALVAYPANKSGASYTVPKNVIAMEYDAFYGCKNLERIEVEAGNTAFSSDDGVLYCIMEGQKVLVLYPPKKDDASYVIPNGVVFVSGYAFYGCENLKSLFLPSTLSQGAYAAIYPIMNIITLVMYSIANDNITIIGVVSNNGQTSIFIPNELCGYPVAAFGDGAFGSMGLCPYLETLFLPDGLDVSKAGIPTKATQVEYTVSDGKITITDITLGDGKTSVAIPETIGGMPVVAIDEGCKGKVLHTCISDGGVTTTEPTATAPGVKTYSCTICGKVLNTEDIPATGSGNTDEPTRPTRPTTPTIPTTPTPPTTPTTPTTPKEPEIKGENGKSGWDSIEEELKDIEEGDKAVIDMNGATMLPKNILEAIEGKDIDIVLDMGNGITWTINGQDIENPEAIDLNVSNISKIPAKVINKVTGEKSYVALSIRHDGDFGFTATLTIDLGKKNKNLYANLYYYNTKTKKTEFVGSCKIDKNGDADFLFTHASDYIIIIDKANHAKPQPKATSTKDSITLRWKAVPGAEKYEVYKYVNGKAVKVKETKKLGFKFTKLKPGKKYSYIVRAYVDGKWTTMKKSDIVTVTTKKK